MQNIWGPHSDLDLTGDQFRDEVQLHLARNLGDAEPAFIDADGWNGKSREPGPPVDVLVVPPDGERRFAYVSSFGGSLRRIGSEKGAAARRIEFVLAAPQKGDEDADRSMLNLAANTVRQFAKLAHIQPVRIAPGDTVAFSENPEPMFEGSGQVAFAFMEPRLPGDAFKAMAVREGEKVTFIAPVPIYRDELEVGHDRGATFLAQALIRNGVTEMLDFTRPSVFQGKKPVMDGWFGNLIAMFRSPKRR
jgi:hypothetical protein